MNTTLLLLKISRPILWVIPPVFFYVGFLVSNAPMQPAVIIQTLLFSIPYCLALFGVNDVYDYESDKRNPRKDSAQGSILKPENHKFVMNIVYAMMLIIMFVSVLTLNIKNIIFTFLLLLVSYYYSAPPIRLKERPPLDSLSNGTAALLCWLAGVSYGSISNSILVKGIFLSICIAGFHSSSALMDYKADKAARNKTIATLYGKRAAAVFPLLAFVLAILLGNFSTQIINYFLTYCAVHFLILSIYPSPKLTYYFSGSMFTGLLISIVVFINNLNSFF